MARKAWGRHLPQNRLPRLTVHLPAHLIISLENAAHPHSLGLPGSTSGKEPAYQCRRCKRGEFNPWVGTIPWRKAWPPTPVLLPGKSHGQSNLAGYSPQCPTELDMTEVTYHACMQEFKLFREKRWI